MRASPERRFHFFAGKGGVGKTSTAAACAAAAAGRGKAVLLVSTDPAHSLGDALRLDLGPEPRRVPAGRGSLHAVELDADQALARWLGARRDSLETVMGRGTYLDRADIERLLDLSLPGVDELIGLLELFRLSRAGPWREVVVDTAPTGHTLRLLEMPATLRRVAAVLDDLQAKHRFLAASLGGGHHPDRHDRMIAGIDREAAAIQAVLRDPVRCSFLWVTLPERLCVEETLDGIRALEAASYPVSELLVNRVTPVGRRCGVCAPRAAVEHEALAGMRRALPGRYFRLLPALAAEPLGIAALAAFGRRIAGAPRRRRLPVRARAAAPPSPPPPAGSRAAPFVLQDALPCGIELLCFGGKGGVGKTTAAAAAALALARRRPRTRILLLSTDPAHSLGDVLDVRLGDDPRALPRSPGHLRARELDAERLYAAERERFRATIDRLFEALSGTAGVEAPFDRAVLRDLFELAPPGLDELFGTLSLLEALRAPRRGRRRFDLVVLDTAPTGHALRLLEMPEAALEWVHALLAVLLRYREVAGLGDFASRLLAMARDLKQFQALLRDPGRCGFVVVTRSGRLPLSETARLLDALERLGMTVPALLLNAAQSGDCADCRRRAAEEKAALAELGRRGARGGGARCAIILAPAEVPPPRGVAGLERWARRWRGRRPGRARGQAR